MRWYAINAIPCTINQVISRFALMIAKEVKEKQAKLIFILINIIETWSNSETMKCVKCSDSLG